MQLMRFLFTLLAVSLALNSLACAEDSESQPSREFQRVTFDKISFHGILKTLDDGLLTFEFSEKRPGPKTESFRFWGISITRAEELSLLLRDRVLSCQQIYEIDRVGYVDCLASPSRGAEHLLSGTTRNWLDLFVWLPELGLAEKHCNLPKQLQILTSDPAAIYFCRTVNDRSATTVRDQVIPIRAGPASPPAPY